MRGAVLLQCSAISKSLCADLNESKTSNQTNPWLRGVTYATVFVVLNYSIGLFCFEFYGLKPSIDWVLVTIYALLSLFSFYVFVVNDIHATKLKGRAMALGFLAGHLALTVLVMSFVFATPAQLSWYAAGLLMVASYLFGTYGINKWSRHHRRSKATLQHELITDELTQLFNRRAFASNAIKEREFCMNSNSDLSVLIIDIDDFKLINDQYGHAVGDEVLIQVSQTVQRHVRRSDSVYRWGGEEFVVLLPVTGIFEAHQVANKLVKTLADTTFNIKDLVELRLTVSIGVSQWIAGESISKETLIRADKALYKAKQSGKNAAVVADFTDISHSNPDPETSKEQSKRA